MIAKYCFLASFLTLLFMGPLMAQKTNNYDSDWKKVDELINKGLPKSAADEVDKLYDRATKEDNQPQRIKALVYKSRLIQQVEENSWYKNVMAFEQQTDKAPEPAKQILHSILADLYWQYFQRKRYEIYDRSNTINFKKDDPETWTALDFHETINKHYQASLTNKKLLQQTKLEGYDPLIIKGNQRKLRPTLFDLLANEALDYYKTEERDITRPAYQFLLNDEASLAPAKTFVRHTYKSADSLSRELNAIQIYQELIRFHLQENGNNDLAALADADIARLQYAYNHQVNEAKEQLYKETLEQQYNQYKTVPEGMQAGYLLALWWKQKGDEYQPGIGTLEDKFALKQALDICKEVVAKFPESEGGVNAYNLLNQIQLPYLSVQTEKVNTINTPFRARVEYKNLGGVYLRLVQLDTDSQELLEGNSDYISSTQWGKLTSLKVLKSWNQALPVIADFRNHSAEIKVDGLATGKYLLLASADKTFSTGKNQLAASVLYVSNISFANSSNDYFILDRVTGKPLPNASVQVYESNYDYSTRTYTNVKSELLKTDKNGFVKLNERNNRNARNIRLDISYNKDRLFLRDEQYSYRMSNDVIKNDQTDLERARYFIFTDRSIYRPGQIVYFKAIGIIPGATGNNTSANKLFVPAEPVVVELKDANYQVIDTMALKANEYGSIHGQFKLPETGLTGEFALSIRIPNGSAINFSVEEYKRPKYFVAFDTLRSNYKLNDTIRVTGTAKAYAGNNIDGASVSYRVYRNTRFLYPWLFYSRKVIWPPYGNNEAMEITSGVTTTDADGKFSIQFTAIPNLSVDKKLDPTFDYTIEVDVTDLNGETRSGKQLITVGYKSLLVKIDLPGGMQQDVDSIKPIKISTTNLAGEYTPAQVGVKIYQLIAPQRLIRERYWQQPDTSVMSYAEYIRYFPHDEYANESDYKTWARGKLMLQESFNTKDTYRTVVLPSKTFTTGYYVIEATSKDSAGNEIKTLEWFALNDYKNNKFAAPEYNITQTIDGTVEPGEKATFIQGTAANDLFIVEQVIKKSSEQFKAAAGAFNYVSISNGFKQFQYAAREEDRGGYTVNHFFVKDNRLYTTSWYVDVPWTNKELKISFETFRDKLLPGQEEKWKVKITGSKGEAVAAEMLASMYDASLDQFRPHTWTGLNIWEHNYAGNNWSGHSNFTTAITSSKNWNATARYFEKTYDELIGVGGYYGRNTRMRGMYSVEGNQMMEMKMVAPMEGNQMPPAGEADSAMNAAAANDSIEDQDKKKEEKIDNANIQIRKNFNETAFFFPDLHTNEQGDIEFSFSIPEALTQWKLQTLAHTKDLSTAMATRSIITQKELMVQPNAPRFFRQGDSLTLVTKVVNLSDKTLNGSSQLQLINSNTLEVVDVLFGNKMPVQNFTVPAGQSIAISFPISIPMQYTDAVSYRITAKAGDISDGEEMALPVLTNRMLVTESFPLNVRGTQTKTFHWNKLLQSGNSTSLQNKSLTVEYSSNPVWYAVQALPYLMEYPYDCAEQTWNRFYANALAAKIASSMPKIKAVFEQWKTSDTAALMSNLQKNQELKAVLLEETPWVLAAKTEAEQKKNIALLFDMVKMANEAAKAMSKLQEMQSSNGGFVWFKGGPDDRYMTQYILSGIGHLKKLEAWPAAQQNALNDIIAKAIPYLDARLKEDYDNLLKSKADLKKNQLSGLTVQWLYMRSFYPAIKINTGTETAYQYYMSQAKTYWTSLSKYEQGMAALALYRNKDNATANAILKSLEEFSIHDEEFGMYWKEFNSGGYYWWQAPIESHALLTEAFSEIENNATRIDDLKTWLLKQKQTSNWRTTKATAEACYALLMQGNNWMNAEQSVTIQLGDLKLSPNTTEAGTGYFKTTVDGEKIKPSMGDITVKVIPAMRNTGKQNTVSTSWGAVYWQYFEDLDKITPAATPVSLVKKLFIVRNSDRGPVLTPVNDKDQVKVGDKIKVRIELRTDRNLEYVHLKDMRASCFEPVNVLSEYKYQGGLGYYEATKDASSNFFIGYMSKGTYVFEYELLATHTGNFSNGITSVQCMYAPEFASHSEGIRVNVVK